MKLSATTLGCPNWDMDKIIEQAVYSGLDGIDFRGYKGCMNIYKLPEFTTNINKTKNKFKSADLEISCFSSSVNLISKNDPDLDLEEIREYVRLCKVFDTQFIRVFGGKLNDRNRAEALNMLLSKLRKIQEIIKGSNVKVLIETHDDWTNCEDVRKIMNQVNSEDIGVLWDVHHPYRELGEQPEKTWDVIGNWIEYTHWKDSFLKDEHQKGFQYCLMGEGDVPLERIYNILNQHSFSGWYTLEWEKKWHPEIEEPELAFPQYVQYMRELERSNNS